MKTCEQTQGQTIYQHGIAVWEKSKLLISGDFTNFQLPDFFKEHHAFIVNRMHNLKIFKDYNIFHDCGKPYCKILDLEGKAHFPEHAVESFRIAKTFIKNQHVPRLILNDMVLHTSTVAQIEQLNLSEKDSMTLIITAFAELHANAEMFGGQESLSFKIKYKKLVKNSKALFFKFLKNPQHVYSYVFVRNDLTSAQKAVQGGHAIAEYYKLHDKLHYSLIYLVVKDEKKLKNTVKELIEHGINFTIFREPDKNNELTAVATEPLNDSRRKVLKRFMLLA